MQLKLPKNFTFKGKDTDQFEDVMGWFVWDIADREVLIDFRECRGANYQALALLLLYVWDLKTRKYAVAISLAPPTRSSRSLSPSDMWRRLGATSWEGVLFEKGLQFRSAEYKPLLAIRERRDTANALSKAEAFAKGFNIEYEKTLQYVLSELLYNTMEHGQRWFNNNRLQVPSVIQFTWYEKRNEITFVIADLGIGVKAHLENAYPAFEDDVEALRKAIQPQVSGTFGKLSPYTAKNNAGVGLYISSNIVQKLHADMHLVSGKGLLHVSPRDVTSRALPTGWPGTFVLVTIRLSTKKLPVDLHGMLSQARDVAAKEIAAREGREVSSRMTMSMMNYFGKYAEDKSIAIAIRDRRLIPGLEKGQDLLLNFDQVVSAPHSFLSALLATPVRNLGMSAYKRIRVTNANPEIRETIDYIFDENTESQV